jgi:hypothetical protein
MNPYFLSGLAVFCIATPDVPVVHGITFAEDDGLYVSVRDLAVAMEWVVEYEAETKRVHLQGEPLDAQHIRKLLSGETLVRIEGIRVPGARVLRLDDGARLEWGALSAAIKAGEKRVEINLTTQRLTAYQGDRVVLETPISSGRRGYSTPTGSFTAGPAKHRMHYSTLYDNSPMPFSIQVTGNIFIHGYHSVPPRPASHGCIRVPLKNGNPAKWLFEWIEIGTPIKIFYEDSVP